MKIALYKYAKDFRVGIVSALVILLIGSFLDADEVLEARAKLAECKKLSELCGTYRTVAKAVEPSVVRIEIRAKPNAAIQRGFRLPEGFELPPGIPDEFRQFFETPFTPDKRRQPQNRYREFDVPQRIGMGSGWIYDRQGHIVTNNHVVANAETIVVKLYDNREIFAKLIGTDPQTDIAVIKINGGNLYPLDSTDEPVEQGDVVFAFGCPLEFEFSMSSGIVSGKHRTMGLLGPTGFENFIQTDAAINPGNSGGPLVNVWGKLVGMNTAIASGTGLFVGLGFAIPAPMIHQIVPQLIKEGVVRRGYLGVAIQDDPNLLKSFGYEGKGVVVSEVVPGLTAEKAGLEPGDIITKVDGTAVGNNDELRQLIARKKPNSTVKLSIIRSGKSRELNVELSEMPKAAVAKEIKPKEAERPPEAGQMESLRKLGFEQLSTLTPDLARRIGIKETSGVLIEEVRPYSAAAEQGIVPGIVIIAVMNKSVTSLTALNTAIAGYDLHRGLRFTVSANQQRRYIFLKLPQ